MEFDNENHKQSFLPFADVIMVDYLWITMHNKGVIFDWFE